MVGPIEAHKKIIEISRRVRPCKATLYQKVDILSYFAAAFPPTCAE